MYLTKDEEQILDGEFGYASQVAMRILVALGDVFEADALIPVESAHISGVSHKTLGEAVEFLEELEKEGARVRVHSTINPCGLDLEKWAEMPVSRSLYEAQLRIVKLYSSMGIDPALTCTPYYLKRVRKGAHLAWSESSAISYANSLLGARTNREGGPSALAAALIGKTPRYGLHLDENRKGDYLVDVHATLKSAADYGALGILVGRVPGMRVPVFRGLGKCPRGWLKSLGAGMAATGAVPLYHVMGVTPEWLSEGESGGFWREGKPEEATVVEEEQLKDACATLTTSRIDVPDLAFIGCPHCSVSEIQQVARLMEGRRMKKDVRFWLCASRRVESLARRKGLIAKLEAAGVEVYCDTCIIVTWLKEAGVDSIITNSGKAAYYAPQLC
ncbi:MAG: aconitase X catalytic domain-containing protein, partial [Candidatus Bathyarchaeia archaeon]